MKKLHLGIFYFTILLYLEVIFRLLKVNHFFSKNLIYIILFIIPCAILFSLLGRMFKKEVINKIINTSIISLLCILFNVHFIYSEIFDVHFSFSIIKLADQAVTFWKEGLIGIVSNIIGVILLLLPIIVVIILNKKINFNRITKKELIITACSLVLSYLIFLGTLFIGKNKTHSAYQLHYKINNNTLSIQTLGLLNTSMIDVGRIIFNFEEDIEVVKKENKEEIKEKDNEKETKYKYQISDIDFDSLIKKEENNTLKTMHEYFASDSGTLENNYTGFYKDKNLILFMAETFNEIAVSEELTPTLYKLVNSSFVFNNYYTQTNNSTIGGEFQELTGLFADSSIFSTWKKGTNYFPYGIANVFKAKEYSTYAYHNHYYTFQGRNKYLASLGFDNFLGCRNGLEKKINCKIWPESDVAMIEATYEDWINEENFMVFYATVSGHGEYSWSNAMSKKHKSEVEDLDYSEKVKAYLAAQMELDKALELLLEKLKEEKRLDDTVIALVGDHYPYYLTIDEINEVASYKKDEVVEVNKSNFILWNNKTKTIEIDKVASQIDVLPTLYNLFGIEYDSRLIIGKDVLSTEEGLAIFNDRSWVSDYGTYFAASNKFVPKKDKKVPDDYVEKMNTIVANKINMSKMIIENDYYKKVAGDK